MTADPSRAYPRTRYRDLENAARVERRLRLYSDGDPRSTFPHTARLRRARPRRPGRRAGRVRLRPRLGHERLDPRVRLAPLRRRRDAVSSQPVLPAGAAAPTRTAAARSPPRCSSAFATWTAVSAAWSPLPSLARDDGLLALFYAVALPDAARHAALRRRPACGDRRRRRWLSRRSRYATAVRLRTGGDPDILYNAGRLDFPVTYWNGEAAIALVAFWPAIALVAERSSTRCSARLRSAGRRRCSRYGSARRARVVASRSRYRRSSFFAVSPARLRLLVPTFLAGGLAALGAASLTEPFRTDGARLRRGRSPRRNDHARPRR